MKLQSPAVKRMKKGSSFFGYTDTSWKAGSSSLSAHSEIYLNAFCLSDSVILISTCAAWIGIEQMSLLKRIGQESEGALPGAVEQVEGAVHPLPVLQVEERVRYRLGVAPLCYWIGRVG